MFFRGKIEYVLRFSLIALILDFALLTNALPQNGVGTAVISGVITEATEGAFLESVNISLINEFGVIYKTQSDSFGRYSIQVADGRYKMKAEGRGVYPFERSWITIAKGDKIRINFNLIYDGLTEIVRSESHASIQKVCTNTDPPFAEEIILQDRELPLNQLSISFGSKEVDEGLIKYRGFETSYGDCSRLYREAAQRIVQNDKSIQAITTFDKITISADEILFNKALFAVVFLGNVTIENGEDKKQFDRIELDLKSGLFSKTR